jgi:hypothetical protein
MQHNILSILLILTIHQSISETLSILCKMLILLPPIELNIYEILSHETQENHMEIYSPILQQILSKNYVLSE